MAWIFSLSAECGSEQAAAEKFANHFNGVSWILSCSTDIFQDLEENWWCRVCSEIGIELENIDMRIPKLARQLYKHLQTAPSFRYALVGIEVDEFRTYRELLDEAPYLMKFPGLVLSEEVWEITGSSPAFQPFSSGYVWYTELGELKLQSKSVDLFSELF
jgi:hypothetical protein